MRGEDRRENIYKRKSMIRFDIYMAQRIGRTQWAHINKMKTNGKITEIIFLIKKEIRTDICLPSTKWQAEH